VTKGRVLTAPEHGATVLAEVLRGGRGPLNARQKPAAGPKPEQQTAVRPSRSGALENNAGPCPALMPSGLGAASRPAVSSNSASDNLAGPAAVA